MLMVKAKNLKENVYNIYVAAENPQTEYNSEAIANIIKTVFNHKKETYKFGLVAFEKNKKDDKKTIKSSSKNPLNTSENNTSLLAIPITTDNLKLINASDSWLNELFSSCKSPIITFKKIKTVKIENIIAAIDLEIDFMPFIFKLQKLMQSMKDVNLHIVSALKNTNQFNINKATQQLSYLNELFTDDKINFTAEIVCSQSEEVSKFRIVLDHIKRVNADIILINKNSFTNNNHFDHQSNLFELLSKSETPIITFV